MNLNEIMFRLTYNNQHINQDNMLVYLVYAAVIGLELGKYRVLMLEMDPKNLYQSEDMDIKLASCLKFFSPGILLSNLQEISSDNVR